MLRRKALGIAQVPGVDAGELKLHAVAVGQHGKYPGDKIAGKSRATDGNFEGVLRHDDFLSGEMLPVR
jgi:hypothetical protein